MSDVMRARFMRCARCVVLSVCAVLALGTGAFAEIANDWWQQNGWHTVDEINTMMNMLATTYSSDCRILTLQTSSSVDAVTTEGRKIYALELCKNGITPKGDMVITGCQHGCEWPGAECALRVARYLLVNKNSVEPISELDPEWASVKMGKNITIKRVMDNMRIVVVPVVNPDGHNYAYLNRGSSVEEDKAWRRNRSPHVRNGTTYHGVDLNRNWPWQWYVGSEQGANAPYPDQLLERASPPTNDDEARGYCANSQDPSKPNYVGPSAASEVEVQAIKRLFETRNVIAAMDYHTYAGKVIYGPGYVGRKPNTNPAEPDTLRFYKEANKRYFRLQDKEDVTDYKILQRTAQAMASHMTQAAATAGSYGSSNICLLQTVTVLYPCYGSCVDWMYEGNGNKHTLGLGVELRYNEYHPENYRDVCKENIPGAIFLASWAADMAQKKSPVTPAKK